MQIEVDDMVVTLAVLIFHGIQMAAEGLVSSGPEHIDLYRYPGLVQSLDKRLGDGAVAHVILSRPGGDNQQVDGGRGLALGLE